jgi:hypothetical protein
MPNNVAHLVDNTLFSRADEGASTAAFYFERSLRSHVHGLGDPGGKDFSECVERDHSLTATAALELDRRAFDAAEGAEDATIATVRAQELATLLALVEKHACVRRHRFKRLGAACRTGNG